MRTLGKKSIYFGDGENWWHGWRVKKIDLIIVLSSRCAYFQIERLVSIFSSHFGKKGNMCIFPKYCTFSEKMGWKMVEFVK